MRVENRSFFMGEEKLHNRHGKQTEASASVSKHNSINGNALNQQKDPITQKKEQAQKRAMRLLSNAFESEKRIDKSLDNRRSNIEKLQNDRSEAIKDIDALEAERAELKSKYDVEDNSQEQKDLELLEKEKLSKFAGSGVKLSDEDREALAELKDRIKKDGLTEYQEKSLEKLDREENSYRAKKEAEVQIDLDARVIEQTKVEKAKSDPMAAANKKADAIKESANRQVIGMLMDEAKAYIDETAQEKQEQAQEKKEKKEELEERIESVKEKKEETEKLTENILEGKEIADSFEGSVNSAQQEVKAMMSKMKLIEDDIKGATVDTTL